MAKSAFGILILNFFVLRLQCLQGIYLTYFADGTVRLVKYQDRPVAISRNLSTPIPNFQDQ
jgi:hypothetical protein